MAVLAAARHPPCASSTMRCCEKPHLVSCDESQPEFQCTVCEMPPFSTTSQHSITTGPQDRLCQAMGHKISVVNTEEEERVRILFVKQNRTCEPQIDFRRVV